MFWKRHWNYMAPWEFPWGLFWAQLPHGWIRGGYVKHRETAWKTWWDTGIPGCPKKASYNHKTNSHHGISRTPRAWCKWKTAQLLYGTTPGVLRLKMNHRQSPLGPSCSVHSSTAENLQLSCHDHWGYPIEHLQQEGLECLQNNQPKFHALMVLLLNDGTRHASRKKGWSDEVKKVHPEVYAKGKSLDSEFAHWHLQMLGLERKWPHCLHCRKEPGVRNVAKWSLANLKPTSPSWPQHCQRHRQFQRGVSWGRIWWEDQPTTSWVAFFPPFRETTIISVVSMKKHRFIWELPFHYSHTLATVTTLELLWILSIIAPNTFTESQRVA